MGRVQIVLSQREENVGYEQMAINTEWTEEVIETEQLMELPHPIP
jgi:hypothetical protein